MPDILFEKHGGVATVSFNRPAVKNALSILMVQDLIRITRELRDDDDLRVVVFRGEGPDFTAGADLNDLTEVLKPDLVETGIEQEKRVRALSMPISFNLDAVKAPIVVSFRGHSIGFGTQLVLAADIVLASTTGKLLLPNVRLAHVTDHGESYLLPRKIGLGRALQMTLLSETVTAETAERYGLVNFVTPDGELEAKTAEIVQRLAASPREAVRQCKALMKASLSRSYAEQFEAEAVACGVCAAHPDYAEAIHAFLERRRPVFA